MLKRTRVDKGKILQATALLIAFGLLVATVGFLAPQGFGGTLTVIFLGYCAIIVVAHLGSALLLLWRAWRQMRSRPKALLLWQTRRK
jgi:hypothetical protein